MTVYKHARRADEDMPPALERLSDYVGYGAQTYPERVALMSAQGQTTYSQLDVRIRLIARSLIGHGVRHGDRVGILSPPCEQFFELFLAAISIGAIAVGLNPRYSQRELAHPLHDCRPDLVFTRPVIDGRNYLSDLEDIGTGQTSTFKVISLSDDVGEVECVTWSDFLNVGTSVDDKQLEIRRDSVSASDVCLIVYTSGTTGQPKGAMLTHWGLVYCSRTDARYNLHAEGQRILCNFPINHIACVGDVCATTLVVGGSIFFMEAFDPRGVLQAIQDYQITHLGQIPAMLQMELGVDDFESFDLSSIRQILWGGNPASIDLIRRLRLICPNLANVYGMTETTGNVLFVTDAAQPDEVFAGSVGWPPKEYEVAVFQSDMAPAPVGEVGEIHVRGSFLMKGYWNNEQATKEAFTEDGWLKTGDLARQNEDGSYSIAGRRSQMYKSGGYNIYPAEIEQAIERHPLVAMAAVIGVADPLYSEVGHAFVIPGNAELTVEDLKAHCSHELANYKRPKRFTIRQDLPMLANGKIDKLALKALVTPQE